MPLVSNITQAEEQFRRTLLTEKIETIQTVNMATPHLEGMARCYYTVTGTDFYGTKFRSDYSLASQGRSLSFLGKQAPFLALANSLFQGTKPLVGKEMDVLNKTFSRLRSSVPTKL